MTQEMIDPQVQEIEQSANDTPTTISTPPQEGAPVEAAIDEQKQEEGMTEEVQTEKEYVVVPVTYAVGFDFGNAEIGIVLLKLDTTTGKVMQRLTRTVPTAFAKINPSVLRNMGVEVKGDSVMIRMKDEQAWYAIGSVAMTQSSAIWNGLGDITRYASPRAAQALIALTASMVPDKEFNLLVVSGLPAETYTKNATLRKEIKTNLTGTYEFSIDGNKELRKVRVEIGTVMMEGAGALVAYGGKDAGARAAGVIDIGGRTCDLYAARGQVPMTEYCKGKPVGVLSASQMLQESFENKYNAPLDMLEARSIMYAYAGKLAAKAAIAKAEAEAAKAAANGAGGTSDANGKGKAKRRGGKSAADQVKAEYPEMSVSGKTIPAAEIEQLVNEAVDLVAQEIVSFVQSSWRQSDASNVVASRFNPVIAIGGGVFYFYDILRLRIPHLQMPDDPSFANAQGYALGASRLLMRKLEKQTAKASS